MLSQLISTRSTTTNSSRKTGDDRCFAHVVECRLAGLITRSANNVVCFWFEAYVWQETREENLF